MIREKARKEAREEVGTAAGEEVLAVRRETAVRWVTEEWDAPAPARLREQMSAELAPRYAPVEHRRVRAPQPAAEEIVVTWVAYADEVPVATASLRRLPDRHEVKRVFVHAEHRGRGLARAALAAVESTALGLGVDRLWLQTGALQPEARALYAREGWEEVRPYAPYDRNPFSVCFTKALIQPAETPGTR
ncbi:MULTISPECIES: GNAT family N-acetyltransferase [Streptomyces]|uniref:GNAT family N-acetyltransferase n=1 Tax=Streptomyces sp. LRE541 TaxID=2931983 RepID=UPI00200CC7B7|nr:GNAT family N-acetyltransferase [Streptomyces sp. LRE541]UPZ27758.1 GNAT family N-acetyltransferase [Streptomyces sp. LRE541]